MKRKLILVLLAAGLLLMGTGCSTFDYSSSGCSSSSGCNAIIYCGKAGCAGYWGGRCNC